MLKVQFHIHTASDPVDRISHTETEMLDFAAAKGYDVVSITCHNKIVFSEELKNYAAEKNMLLIPGIEKTVAKKHVLIINAASEAENVHTFSDLKKYRAAHPESLIIAPHPYFHTSFCLEKWLEQYIELFDAIEYSFFHTTHINWNKKAVEIAKKYGKPLIGTSDNHFLPLFDQNYSLVFADKNSASIVEAIRHHRIEFHAAPLSLPRFLTLYSEMFFRCDLPRRVQRMIQYKDAESRRSRSHAGAIEPQTDRVSGRA